jgi:hypothetical protein
VVRELANIGRTPNTKEMMMNRIEIAAGHNSQDLTPLENNASALSVSCTPGVFVMTLVGTFAGAAVSYKVVYGFDAGTPDAVGEIQDHTMQVGDLLSARKAAITSVA